MPKKLYDIPASELKRYYVDMQLSTNDIARIYHCNCGTIYFHLLSCGITPRNRKEAPFAGVKRRGSVITLPIDEIIHLYVDERTPAKIIGKRFGCSKWLICDRLRKAGIPLRTREIALTNYGRANLSSPEMRKKLSESGTVYWRSDPERKSKRIQQIMLAATKSPTKPEIIVNKILDELFPDEWKFVGDGQVVLGGLNPDFINTNGKKLIIEVFGDYWHRRPNTRYSYTEQGRKETFTRYGYRTLVLWEKEIKNTEAIKGRIIEFVYSTHTT